MAKKSRKSRKAKKSVFAGKVRHNAEKTRAGATYGYLNLPKGVGVFSPKPKSKALLDFVPYEVTDPKHPDRDDDLEIAVPGSLWYRRPFQVHRNIGSNNESVVCLRSIGKKCPICEARADMIKQGADKEDTDALKPSKRCLYIVVPREMRKVPEEPHIFDMSEYLFQNLLTEELQEDEENEIFPDPEIGKTLKIRFSASTIGKSKPFAEASRIDFIDRDEPIDEDILDGVPNLDKVLNILSYSQLEKLFLDVDVDDEGDGEEPPWEDEDDEDGDGDEEEEEEEEEEKSRSRRRSKRSKKDRESKGKKKNKKNNKKKNPCPYGYEFGVDLDEHDECEKCKKWDDCLDKNEELDEED